MFVRFNLIRFFNRLWLRAPSELRWKRSSSSSSTHHPSLATVDSRHQQTRPSLWDPPRSRRLQLLLLLLLQPLRPPLLPRLELGHKHFSVCIDCFAVSEYILDVAEFVSLLVSLLGNFAYASFQSYRRGMDYSVWKKNSSYT